MKKQILFLTILTLNASCWAIGQEIQDETEKMRKFIGDIFLAIDEGSPIESDSKAHLKLLISNAIMKDPIEAIACLIKANKHQIFQSSDDSDSSASVFNLVPQGSQSVALEPILAENQIRLTNNNIFDDTDDLRVFYLSLDLSTIEDAQAVIDNLNGRTFHNLRSIRLKKGVDRNTSRFLTGLFDKTMKFPSLTTITVQESKIDDRDLYNIYEHFSRYDYLIRDLEQWSSRHDCVAAPITLNLDRETKKGLNSMHKWNGGVKSKGFFMINFRSSDKSVLAPFVMSTR